MEAAEEGSDKILDGEARAPSAEAMNREDQQEALPRKLPETIRGTVTKASKTDNVGLALGVDAEQYIIISHINQKGLFAQHTSLQKGMRVVEVNGRAISQGTPLSRVQPMVQERMIRQITIVAMPTKTMTAESYDWSKHQEGPPPVPDRAGNRAFQPDRSQVPLDRTCCFLCPKYCDDYLQKACCMGCCLCCCNFGQ